MDKTDGGHPKGATKSSAWCKTWLQHAFEFSKVKVMNPYPKRNNLYALQKPLKDWLVTDLAYLKDICSLLMTKMTDFS